MITSKTELKHYIEADAQKSRRPSSWNLVSYLTDPLWLYQRLLRKREYLVNTKPKRGWWRIVRWVNGFRLYRLSTRLGIDIPPNCFGPGLYITHVGTIVVNPKVRIGKNCVLNVCVNIGNYGNDYDAVPTIGDNCFIGPGAKLFGKITIGDNTKIGANAVVNKSFPEGNCTLVGVPARMVTGRSSH